MADNDVEKSFNDDELADIMNEIESLEQEFEVEAPAESESPVEQEASTESPQDVADEIMASDDVQEEVVEEPVVEDPVEQVFEDKTEEVKEVVSEMVQRPVEEVVPTPSPAPAPAPAPVHHIPTPKNEWKPSGAQTSMSFNVEGDMKLSMSFHVSGKEFNVWVDEKDGFVIELDGGAQFKVPIDQAHKKAA